ncbi:MAG: ABC transporter permease [Actinomycetaceae bacterium]|nr:ABC transporter permease [Actinomycetaceae bacterium]
MNYFLEALTWLATGANWVGHDGIWMRLVEHAWYSVLGVAISAIIAIPLGLYIGHTGRGRGIAVGLTGGLRALPTLGILTLAGLWLGIGLGAPMIAFVVLATPSILAGTYAGVESVNRDTVDAAHAQGMTPWQVLTKVEVPLAAPLIIGGLRSAMLQVIATATLAAYVGAGGFGRYLFLGLRTQNYSLMVSAALLVIALAIIFEIIFVTIARSAAKATGLQPKESAHA